MSKNRLSALTTRVQGLDNRLQKLTDTFEEYSAEKNRIKMATSTTKRTIKIANRLIDGLSSENERWNKSISKSKEQGTTLAGDILLSAAFVIYAGGFSQSYRKVKCIYDLLIINNSSH